MLQFLQFFLELHLPLPSAMALVLAFTGFAKALFKGTEEGFIVGQVAAIIGLIHRFIQDGVLITFLCLMLVMVDRIR